VERNEYIQRLQMVIHQLHKLDSRHIESVPVEEVFQGQVIWRGTVEVFSVTGNPKATRCYAWSHRTGKNDEGERVVAVLGLPPVDSAHRAVQVAIASDVRSQNRLDKKTKT
jgi:hypothetical protein